MHARALCIAACMPTAKLRNDSAAKLLAIGKVVIWRMIQERTCVGCRKKSGKTSFHRIVRCADGAIKLDVTSKAPGRGAYLCSIECLKKAFKSGRLSSALRARVTEDAYEGISASPVWATAAADTDGEE